MDKNKQVKLQNINVTDTTLNHYPDRQKTNTSEIIEYLCYGYYTESLSGETKINTSEIIEYLCYGYYTESLSG